MIVYIFVIIIYCIFLREHILTVNKSTTIFFFFPSHSKEGLISILKGELGRFSTAEETRRGSRRAKYFEKLEAKKKKGSK